MAKPFEPDPVLAAAEFSVELSSFCSHRALRPARPRTMPLLKLSLPTIQTFEEDQV